MKYAKITIEVEGSTHEFIAEPKTYSSGRQGYYTRIGKFATKEDNILSGQLQLWGPLPEKSEE
jgi:hypothetical protein